MDLKGQKLCDALSVYLLCAVALGSFLYGIYTQSVKNLFCAYAAGVGVTVLVGVPDWPFYNRKPLKWLDPQKND
ncbi:putative signal peptidase [Chloropicon primus]|uniref:Signal peptidase complex subunit 1 n=1 Tax=Chloropicon primus TaxID=1764295 RepID=A0A5B8MYZ3_9CHLO|nr:putative signal peptidase [Chloropicon primus]UPR05269.1 putative signal peptidase [Chloropicon primus]|eukprot:QDZ26068.1 putative signal peptidase [Chloropicon primus]